MNIQPIEKRERRTDGLIAVHSVFETIQGEGPFCGVPCVFVRLAGCNLQCPACDTDYTSERKLLSPLSLIEWIFDTDTRPTLTPRLVVVTGGEPFRQDITEFLRLLVGAGYYVQIETNGTLPLSSFVQVPYSLNPWNRKGVYVVCSPKTGKIHETVYEFACALKYVVRAGQVRAEDGLPLSALDHASNPYPARPPKHWDRPVYVQPLDSKNPVENAMHMQQAVESCTRFGYTLQIQVHKVVGVD